MFSDVATVLAETSIGYFASKVPRDLPGQQDRAEKEELTERACFFPATPGVFPKTPWI